MRCRLGATCAHAQKSDSAATVALFRGPAWFANAGASVFQEVATARVSEAHHQVYSGPGHRSLLAASEHDGSALIRRARHFVVTQVVSGCRSDEPVVNFRLAIRRRTRFLYFRSGLSTRFVEEPTVGTCSYK